MSHKLKRLTEMRLQNMSNAPHKLLLYNNCVTSLPIIQLINTLCFPQISPSAYSTEFSDITPLNYYCNNLNN